MDRKLLRNLPAQVDDPADALETFHSQIETVRN